MTRNTVIPSLIVAAITMTLLLALGLWVRPNDESVFDPTQPTIAPEEFTALEGIAVSACLCERDGGERISCWSDYRARSQDYEQYTAATACVPVSTVLACFLTSEGERCVVTGYDVNGASAEYRDVKVCTQAEARAIEHASNAPFLVDGQPIDSSDREAWTQANAQSLRNVDEVMTRIRQGEQFEDFMPETEGCV